ncbi:hypothetical protein FD19_GL001435 [Lacticaseibacillus thailandensis DSM 22698 = JCM 13996]|uniref:Uncharacterized protein n=1 Tax=Lacticaseibacillus thailandensis DSM 22698 = JCM 13996 TaxID=1423810 RepID=A0A0R2C6B0_9LACO|nr:hypothetical protein FD19_GL001435 [Lacticaseibacillus thailandensis DSM 22698 = JCM 13996]
MPRATIHVTNHASTPQYGRHGLTTVNLTFGLDLPPQRTQSPGKTRLFRANCLVTNRYPILYNTGGLGYAHSRTHTT